MSAAAEPSGPSRRYLALLGLLAAERLAELAVSNRRERGLTDVKPVPRGYRVMVVTHVLLFLLPPLELRRLGCGRPGRRWWLGLLLSATLLRIWCIRSLGPWWNVRASVSGQTRVVATGPYRWVRHPNYLAVAVEMASVPMVGGAWRSAVGLSIANSAILRQRIRAEEKLLDQLPGYREAFAGRTRFIPGFF